MERPARSPATWCLLALVTLAAALSAAFATRSVLTAAGALRVTEDEVRTAGLIGVFGEDALRTSEGFAALATAPPALVALIVLVGLATWRSWAREAVLAVFGLVGALLCVFAAAGLASGARNGAQWLIGGLVLLVTAGLAVSPPVAADFDRRRIAAEVRERRRREQERRERESEQRAQERHGLPSRDPRTSVPDPPGA